MFLCRNKKKEKKSRKSSYLELCPRNYFSHAEISFTCSFLKATVFVAGVKQNSFAFRAILCHSYIIYEYILAFVGIKVVCFKFFLSVTMLITDCRVNPPRNLLKSPIDLRYIF